MSRLVRRIGKWLTVLGVFAMVCIPLVPIGLHVLKKGRDVTAMACLVHIGMALRSYHDDFGMFPPAYVADRAGRPMHSWRVLLLPYLGYHELYKQYNFEQPWNGPDNRPVGEQVCDIYGSTRDPHTGGTMTRYLAVVGPRTAWPGQHGVRMRDITDYHSNTILLVDFADSDVKWTEPRDLSYNEALASEGRGSLVRVVHHSPKGVLFLDADCIVQRLPQDLSRDTLKGLLTIDGGERILCDLSGGRN